MSMLSMLVLMLMKRWRPGVTVDVSDKTCSTPRLFTKAMWLPGNSTFLICFLTSAFSTSEYLAVKSFFACIQYMIYVRIGAVFLLV